MMSKKKIPEGAKLPVPLSAAERKLIREETFYDPQFGEGGAPQEGTMVFDMDLDTIEDLQGYVAAEANHTEDRKVEQALDKLFFKLQGFLDRYDDQ